jgi:hypothetical protein
MGHYIPYDYRWKQDEAKTMLPGIGHEQPCAEQLMLLSARGFEFGAGSFRPTPGRYSRKRFNLNRWGSSANCLLGSFVASSRRQKAQHSRERR